MTTSSMPGLRVPSVSRRYVVYLVLIALPG